MKTRTTNLTHAQRVQNGIDFLNEHDEPDWFRQIDVEHLHTSSCSQCVLGQRVRKLTAERHSYNFAIVPPTRSRHPRKSEAPEEIRSIAMTMHQAVQRGFHVAANARTMGEDFRELTVEWRKRIQELQNG